jgi:hypothetical protein
MNFTTLTGEVDSKWILIIIYLIRSQINMTLMCSQTTLSNPSSNYLKDDGSGPVVGGVGSNLTPSDERVR